MTRPENLGSMGAVTHLTAVDPQIEPELDPEIDGAVRAADTAASAADVSVRELIELTEFDAVASLYVDIWGRDGSPPMTLELLRAFSKAGNYVGGAYDGERLVGACVGFFHAPAEDALHSHIAGVSSAVAGRSVGFALKLHQRAWAMRRGVSDIAWTFDPLVSRNAYFNLAKLAAEPVEYLPNFYGAMVDTINGAGDSDRLLVRWPLRGPAVAAACAGTRRSVAAAAELAAGAVVGVSIGADGGPMPGRLDADTVLVGVPADIEALRRSDPTVAARWRLEVCEALSGLVRDGARIAGFDRAGWYVVRRHP